MGNQKQLHIDRHKSVANALGSVLNVTAPAYF